MVRQAIFYFYSKSADKLPGKGANERLGDSSLDTFQELQNYSNWRKILSNFSCGNFEFEGSHYRTVEHAFQGKKISLVDQTKGFTFALESNSRLSIGDGDLARKNRKMILLNESELRQWNQMKDSVLEGILRAKFTQEDSSKRILLATKDAELWHGARGVPKSRQLSLEKVRLELQQEAVGVRVVESEADAPQSVQSEETDGSHPSKRQRISRPAERSERFGAEEQQPEGREEGERK
jgi:predicted NAD-dependent protein-ADP-ribosyltransferase YbiA (DUF1768 family)